MMVLFGLIRELTMNDTLMYMKKTGAILIGYILTIFAFIFDGVIDQSIISYYSSRPEYMNQQWTLLAIAIFLFYFYYYRFYGKRNKWPNVLNVLLAFIFAVFTLVGKSFAAFDDLSLIFASFSQIGYAVFALIGYMVFYYIAVTAILNWIESNNSYIGIPDFKEKQLALKVVILISICWLPYIIAYYPGGVPHDGMYQLSMWLGYDHLNNQHPWIISAFYGNIMRIGQRISDNFGIFLIIICQYIICAVSFAYVSVKVKSYGGSALLTAFFYGLLPVWGSYVTAVIKDTIFFSVFSVYFCKFIDVLYSGSKQTELKKVLQLLGFSILLCIIRNDGIYRVIFAFLVAFLLIKCIRKSIILCTLLCVFFIVIYNFVSFNVLRIGEGPKGEMFSIPFQQTARYVRDCKGDITLEERQIIDEVLPFDDLAELYNGELSDPVKFKMKSVNKGQFLQYIKVWINMGLRHPDIYIQATLNNTYSYFYPYHNADVMGAYQNYIKGDPVNPGFDIDFADQKARDDMQNYAQLWRVFPGVSLLLNPGFYTWIFLFIAFLMIKIKKWKMFAVLSIPFIHILICVASPVNGLLRYALPLMAITPLMMAWSLREYKNVVSICKQ